MKQNRKTRYTQMVLRDSLIELMKQKPISKITITELCKVADINRSTFYSHYSDQYALLRTIEDEALTWAKDAISSLQQKTIPAERLKLIESILQYFAQNEKHFQILMSEKGDIDFQKQLFALIYNQLGISPVQGKSNEESKQAMRFIFVVNGSVGVIRHWLKNGLNMSVTDMADIIYQMAGQAL